MKHIVLVFCRNLEKDPVSAHVLQRTLALGQFTPTDIIVDGQPALYWQNGDTLYHVLRLDDVLSHDYARYASTLNNQFASADVIVIVNWHEGRNAPNAIFTIQTTGDMTSGTFSPVDPDVTRSLFLAVESERVRAGLEYFSTWMEATHWSGPLYRDQLGSMLTLVNSSVIDLEIGSSAVDWSNPLAADVLARATLHAFDAPQETAISLLCIGGTHFETGFTQILREHGASQRLALSHILPNHWLVAFGYDDPVRLPDLLACARSIVGGVDAVAFHDNLKGSYKEQVRRLAAELGVPALSHRKLRTQDIESAIRDARRP